MMTKLQVSALSCVLFWAVGLCAQDKMHTREDLQRMIQNANGKDEVELRAELAMLYLSEREVMVTQRFQDDIVGYSKEVEAPDLPKALAEINTLQRVATQTNYTDGQAVGYYLEGMYHVAMRDTMQAMRALNQWFAIRTQQKDVNRVRWAYFGKYEYELKLGQRDAAMQTLQEILRFLKTDASDDPEEQLRDGVARVTSIRSMYDATKDERLLYDLLVPELEKLTLFAMANPHFVIGNNPMTRLDYFFSSGIQAALASDNVDKADALGHLWLSSVDRLSQPEEVYWRARRIASWFADAGVQSQAYNFLVVSIDQAKRTQSLPLIHQAYYNNVYFARRFGDMARGLKTLQALYPFTTFDFKYRSALNACMVDYLSTSDPSARLGVQNFLEGWRQQLDPNRDQDLLQWCSQQLFWLND